MSEIPQRIEVSAPARICIMGEHQDYYGLASITAAINLRIYITGVPRNDVILSIKLPDIGETDEIDLNREIVYRKPGDYLRSGLKVLQLKGLKLQSGFTITIRSDIPIAKGISSSSALIVAWITFLLNAASSGFFSPGDIAYDAYRAEVVEFAEAGGMMDQYTSAIGGTLHIDCQEPFTATPLPSLHSGFRLDTTKFGKRATPNRKIRAAMTAADEKKA